MKKYIVRVQYIKRHDLVDLVKAKDDYDLEKILYKNYKNYFDLIEGFEYDEIKNYMFRKKNQPWLLCGSWIGRDYLKGLYENRNN